MNFIKNEVSLLLTVSELLYRQQKLKGRFKVQKGSGEKEGKDVNETCLLQILYAELKLGKKLVTSDFTIDVRGVVRVQVPNFALISFSFLKHLGDIVLFNCWTLIHIFS